MEESSRKWPARIEREQDIIRHARSVFIEQGYSSTSMSTIAARVGGSKSTLYAYFPSKQSLLAAVVKHECERKFNEIFAALALESCGVKTSLRRFADRYVHVILDEDNMRFTRLLIAESIRQPELGEIYYDSGPRRGRALMVNYFESLIAAGVFYLEEPSQFVQQFCDLCLGEALLKRLMNIDLPMIEEMIEKNIEAAIAIVISSHPQIGTVSGQ